MASLPQRPDLRKSRVPELAMGATRPRVENLELDFVDDDIVKFLDPIRESKVIEIMGGLGTAAEHLSVNGNTVDLLEELRLFFVYRRQLFPKSKVTEMNLHPQALKASKRHYDYAIIHSTEFLEFAQKIETQVYNITTKEVYAQVPINSTEVVSEMPKNDSTEQAVEPEILPDPPVDFPIN